MNNDREYSFPELDTLMSVAVMVAIATMSVVAFGSGVQSVIA